MKPGSRKATAKKCIYYQKTLGGKEGKPKKILQDPQHRGEGTVHNNLGGCLKGKYRVPGESSVPNEKGGERADNCPFHQEEISGQHPRFGQGPYVGLKQSWKAMKVFIRKGERIRSRPGRKKKKKKKRVTTVQLVKMEVMGRLLYPNLEGGGRRDGQTRLVQTSSFLRLDQLEKKKKKREVVRGRVHLRA